MSQGRRFKVLGTLGSGGFGTVYRAELIGEGGFRKPVALKILNADMVNQEEVARRFRDEARVLGLVRHSSIVQVDGLAWLDGRWAVVMEYIHGVDLREVVNQGAIPIGPALNITSVVADALHVAYHQVGTDGTQLRLLHRDIKPSNLQLTAAGEVKILDFGTARADFDGREAATRSVAFGTLDYMSPERLDFIDGPPGDVYSMGAVLYEMLCGAALGRTSAHPGRHRNHISEALDQLWKATNGEHEELVRFVAKMLSFDPEDRPLARQVERQCAQFHRMMFADRLRDWAEQVLPPLIDRRTLSKGDQLSGSTLIERIGAPRLDTDHGNDVTEAGPPLSTTWRPISDDWKNEDTAQQSDDPRKTSQGMSALTIIGGIGGFTMVSLVVLAIGFFSWFQSYGQQKAETAIAKARANNLQQAQQEQQELLRLLEKEQTAVQPDQLLVRLVDMDTSSAANLDCGPTYHVPMDIVDNRVLFNDMPRDVACKLTLKGWLPAEHAPVYGGQTLACYASHLPETCIAKSAASTETPEAEAPAPASEPAPAPPAPPETSTPEAPTPPPEGRVRVSGDAERVVLVGNGLRRGAGSLPPGTYRIHATFRGRASMVAGSVTVVSGRTTTINCMAAFTRCTTQ